MPSRLSISSNADQVARRVAAWSDSIGPALARATLEAATVITAQAKQEAPVKTGRLRRSIHYQAGGQGRYVVMPDTPYAVAVHEGTRTHTIRPRGARALFWKGAAHPVRLVRHPGTRPNPYMTRALARSRTRIEQIAARAGLTIVTRQG